MDPFLAKLEAEMAELKGKLAGLEQARSLYVRHLEHSPTLPVQSMPSASARPRPIVRRGGKLRELALNILKDHPGGLNSREVIEFARHRQPDVNDKSMTSALSVAFSEGVLERDADMRYRLPGASASVGGDTSEAEAEGGDDAAASEGETQDDNEVQDAAA